MVRPVDRAAMHRQERRGAALRHPGLRNANRRPKLTPVYRAAIHRQDADSIRYQETHGIEGGRHAARFGQWHPRQARGGA